MRVAALDLGTNSFLLLIQEKDSNGQLITIYDESIIVRLGEGLQSTGKISQAALKRADECLEKFRVIINQYRPDRISAVTTAAAREADNSEEFLKICVRYQIPVVVLSGQEEAQMSFQGALPDHAEGKYLLIDIGGGSTEYVVGTSESVEFSHSIPHGAVKLTEKYITQQPATNNEVIELKKQIRIRSEETWAQLEALKPEKMIAVAGTPTAIAAAKIGGFDAKKINGMLMDLTELENWVQIFLATSIQQKKDQYGLGARADVILAGSILLSESIKRLGMKSFIISTKGIRYGLAHKLFHDVRH